MARDTILLSFCDGAEFKVFLVAILILSVGFTLNTAALESFSDKSLSISLFMDSMPILL